MKIVDFMFLRCLIKNKRLSKLLTFLNHLSLIKGTQLIIKDKSMKYKKYILDKHNCAVDFSFLLLFLNFYYNFHYYHHKPSCIELIMIFRDYKTKKKNECVFLWLALFGHQLHLFVFFCWNQNEISNTNIDCCCICRAAATAAAAEAMRQSASSSSSSWFAVAVAAFSIDSIDPTHTHYLAAQITNHKERRKKLEKWMSEWARKLGVLFFFFHFFYYFFSVCCYGCMAIILPFFFLFTFFIPLFLLGSDLNICPASLSRALCTQSTTRPDTVHRFQLARSYSQNEIGRTEKKKKKGLKKQTLTKKLFFCSAVLQSFTSLIVVVVVVFVVCNKNKI